MVGQQRNEAHHEPGTSLARLAALLRQVDALEPRHHLASSPERIARELAGPLRTITAETRAAASSISAGFDDDSEFAGTCFAIQLEAAHGLRLLDREQDRASLLVACDITRQGLQRAGAALLETSGATDEQLALGRGAALVRALYGQLRQVVDAVDGRSGRRALESVEAALRDARSRPAFESVRLSDRFVIENVHQRFVQLAARAHADVDDISDLVSDAKAAIELLASINRRPELVAYDRHVIETCRAHLAAHNLSRALLVQARALLHGRDEALDLVLASAVRHLERPPVVDAPLLRELARVSSELSSGARF